MHQYKYLVIGGSIAADSAIKAIRKEDKDGTIGMLSDEPFAPYRRPALTKQAWEESSFDRIWLQTEKYGIDMHLSAKAVSLDPDGKKVTDNNGKEYTFEKLLIATGSRPRQLCIGDGLTYFRTLNDLYKLRSATEDGTDFAIIGGGFTGLELAARLNESGRNVKMIFPEESLGSLVFPSDISCHMHRHYQDHGIELMAGELPVCVEKSGDRYCIKMKSGKSVSADYIIASIGCIPNTEFTEQAGLRAGNGIEVDESLRCGHPDIFAAGDVANFYSPVLDKRIRIEHSDNAVNMGRHAGVNMLGNNDPFGYLASFYASMFDVSFKAIGELNPKMEILAMWQEPMEKGTLYYMYDGRVRGVLFWNMPPQFDKARSIINKVITDPEMELNDLFGV